MTEINLDYYSGSDNYSDGDLESEIIHFFQEQPGADPEEWLARDDRLLLVYHLSEVRKSLLSWYEFKPGASVLEIGAGMGAVTGILCEKCKKVVSVEMSKRRASAIATRYADNDNLNVYVADFSKIPFEEKFDYIVVIGALEYQGTYTLTDDPYTDFIRKIVPLLKDDSKLLLSIENRFGIKFWCGAPEDHTHIPYDGINDYRYGGKAKTFSRDELKRILSNAGLPFHYFYYPMPDYRMPQLIFSDDYQPTNEWGLGITPYYADFPNSMSLMADERIIYRELFQNSVFGFFANSFLVEAGVTSERYCDVVFAACTADRVPEKRMCTTIHKDNIVRKRALHELGRDKIKLYYENAMRISIRNSERIGIIPHSVAEGALVMPFCNSETLLQKLCRFCKDKAFEKIKEELENYFLAILDTSDIVPQEMNTILNQMDCKELCAEDFGKIVETLYIELTPANCFVSGDKLLAYDQEFTCKNMPANYMIFRALDYLGWINNLFGWTDFPMEMYKAYFSLDKVWPIYQKYNELFFNELLYAGGLPSLKKARQIDIKRIADNARLISGESLAMNKQIEALNNQLQLRTKELIAAREENISLDRHLNGLKEKFELLKRDFDNLHEGYDNLQIGYTNVKAGYDSLIEANKKLIDDNSSMKEDYNQLRLEYMDLDNKHLILEREYIELETSYDAIEKDIAVLDMKYTALNIEKEALENEIDSLKTDYLILKSEITKIKYSVSYRLGLLFTWLPRKIKSLFHKRF
jgi:2-polyprenyl-3-methyl-5-hydroxy-6-metoxy-1,4-benzoquinol methylase/predicted nuclease with TOPRIM domain